MTDFLPGGSYSLHSRDVRVTLYCKALKRNGTWIPTSLDLTHLEETNVANEDGHLVNLAGDVGRAGYLPHGPYLETTVDRYVILSALCQRRDLRWQWSTLDISEFDSTRYISLLDGVLTVEPHSTN